MTEQRIQLLEDLGAEFTRVADQQEESSRRVLRVRGVRRRGSPSWRRVVAVVAAAAVLVVGGAYAVPATRAGIDDLTSSFAGWVAGDEERAPGRALRPEDDAPDWVREQGGRLIAETAGVGLYVTRSETEERGTLLKFALDEGVGVFDSIEGWRERFDDHAVVVLGPTPVAHGELWDDRGRFPLLGVSARSVDRVELRYATGPPLVADNLHGGFVLMVDSGRALREIVAYDVAGRELERTDVSHIDMRRHCVDKRGCPPGAFVEP